MTCQLPSDIASTQVATADKTLVTLTAAGRSCSLPTSGKHSSQSHKCTEPNAPEMTDIV
jgi:hypothetical protein